MMFRGCTLVFLLFTAVIALAQEPSNSANGDPSDNKKKTTTPATTTEITTTQKPPTSPTTVAPTTLPTKPTTPPTTAPTVPTSPPTSSPPPPTTTPSAPPTPAPAPTTPSPPPSDWVVRDGNKSVCIIANMDMKVSVTYLSSENKSMNAEFKIDKIENAHANGTCVGNTETLVLTIPSLNATFHFAENASDKSYALSSVEVTILVNNQTFPNHTMGNVSVLDLKHSSQVFSVPLNNSYKCEKVDTLNLIGTVNNNTVLGNLFVSKVHVEAFGKKKEASYYTAMDCAATDTPDIVPIVVGLILAGLVVVVLVAYLVGRRRAQARGYLSM